MCIRRRVINFPPISARTWCTALSLSLLVNMTFPEICSTDSCAQRRIALTAAISAAHSDTSSFCYLLPTTVVSVYAVSNAINLSLPAQISEECLHCQKVSPEGLLVFLGREKSVLARHRRYVMTNCCPLTVPWLRPWEPAYFSPLLDFFGLNNCIQSSFYGFILSSCLQTRGRWNLPRILRLIPGPCGWLNILVCHHFFLRQHVPVHLVLLHICYHYRVRSFLLLP